MTHQHVWQKEPPDAISRTSEDKYGDKRDMAHNSFWTSLEELKRLWLLLDEDPEFEKSSDWPVLVEWNKENKEDAGLSAHAHCQARFATVKTFEQAEDRAQVFHDRAAGGVCLATLEGEGGGGNQGGEARGSCQACEGGEGGGELSQEGSFV